MNSQAVQVWVAVVAHLAFVGHMVIMRPDLTGEREAAELLGEARRAVNRREINAAVEAYRTSPIYSLGLVGWALLSRRPLIGFVRDWTRRERPRWPDDLVRYLSGRPSPFEEDLALAPAHIWRDAAGADARRRLLPWIVAATRPDPAERSRDLLRLTDGAPDRPAAAVASWMRGLL